jgi:hypothetical protein
MRAVALWLGISFVSCTLVAPPVPAATTPALTSGPAREPKDLPTLPEEQRVLVALRSVGLDPETIAVSKFQDLFGERRPARSFYAGWVVPGAWRVDIVLFEGPVTFLVCESTDRPYYYRVSYNGRQATMGSTQEVYFAAGGRYLVATSDARARDALLLELGLSVPDCQRS